jgi:hypothetical protein
MTERVRGKAIILDGSCSLQECEASCSAPALDQSGSSGRCGSSTASMVYAALTSLRRILSAPQKQRAIHLNADHFI